MFGMQMLTMLSAIVVMLISMLESCIVNGCLSEYKGTYDESQDPLIAADWDPSEEREKMAGEIFDDHR